MFAFPHVDWQNPHWYLWLLPTLPPLFLIAVWNIRRIRYTRDLWGDRVILDRFTPRSGRQLVVMWVHWIVIVLCLVAFLGGPNISAAPQMARAGAVEFLAKPFDDEFLLECVRSALDS